MLGTTGGVRSSRHHHQLIAPPMARDIATASEIAMGTRRFTSTTSSVFVSLPDNVACGASRGGTTGSGLFELDAYADPERVGHALD